MIEKDFDLILPDYWRLAPNGRATLIRAYREDREHSAKALSRRSGTWLSPETVIRETTEVVTHARFLARHFKCQHGSLFGVRGLDLLTGNWQTLTPPKIGVMATYLLRIEERLRANG